MTVSNRTPGAAVRLWDGVLMRGALAYARLSPNLRVLLVAGSVFLATLIASVLPRPSIGTAGALLFATGCAGVALMWVGVANRAAAAGVSTEVARTGAARGGPEQRVIDLESQGELGGAVQSLAAVMLRLTIECETVRQECMKAQAAEARLRASEEKYRSIFENTIEGIFQTTTDGHYLTSNPALARIYGHRSADDLIAGITDISNQLYAEAGRREEFMRLMETEGEVTGFESQVRRGDGTMIWISENARVVRDGSGTPIYYEGTVQDITRRRLAEERLREAKDAAEHAKRAEAEKALELERTLEELKRTQKQLVARERLASLGGLTAGIAHEIKNPLNFIVNFARLSVGLCEELKETLAGCRDHFDENQSADVDEILGHLVGNAEKVREHADRADGIVRGMLLLSRGQVGQKQPTDLNALVGKCTSLAYHGLRAQDPKFEVEIETEFDPSLEPVNVYPQDLSRAILNIANNACYAAFERRKTGEPTRVPKVVVRTKNLGASAEIRIHDNGAGIPEAVRAKIFDPFFTTKPAGAGTGLGLSITHDIIAQQHRGEVHVESEPDGFTEFVLILPKSAVDPVRAVDDEAVSS